MRDEEKAADYIYMAADNPNVENELPESGVRFWKAAKHEFAVWRARKKFGVPRRRGFIARLMATTGSASRSRE